MGRGLGKIQRILLHILLQYPTGLSFSTLKRMVPEDISKTKGYRPTWFLAFSRRRMAPQRKFDHNIYMAARALAERGLIEIVSPYIWGGKNRTYRITQKGIEYIKKHPVYPLNIKITHKDIVEEKSLYEIMEHQALNNSFNLKKLLEMGYSINEIERTAPLLVLNGILSRKDWKKIREVWRKQWE
jgi:hypothetical protein